MRGHDDEAQDKKLFGKMLKKSIKMPAAMVKGHLKKDVRDEVKAIKDDKKLLKSIKPRKMGRGY